MDSSYHYKEYCHPSAHISNAHHLHHHNPHQQQGQQQQQQHAPNQHPKPGHSGIV